MDDAGKAGVVLGEGSCPGSKGYEHLCRFVERWSGGAVTGQAIVPGERAIVRPFISGGATTAVRLSDGRVIELRQNLEECTVSACGNLEWAEYAPDFASFKTVKAVTRDNETSRFSVKRVAGVGIAVVWTNAEPTMMGGADVAAHMHVGVLDDGGNWVLGPFVTRRSGHAGAGRPSIAYDGHGFATAWTWCDGDDNGDCRTHFVRFDNSDELVKM